MAHLIEKALKKFGATLKGDSKHFKYELCIEGRIITKGFITLPLGPQKELSDGWVHDTLKKLYISRADELKRYGKCSLSKKEYVENLKKKGIIPERER